MNFGAAALGYSPGASSGLQARLFFGNVLALTHNPNRNYPAVKNDHGYGIPNCSMLRAILCQK
jgi:hypothetical protein